MTNKSVYFFCMDYMQDEVAPRVFEASRRLLDLQESDMVVDGFPVLIHTLENGGMLYYVRTQQIICVAYDRYLPIINSYFGDCDLAVMVNWHGGSNAPDKVLCIHTVGDVDSGTFGPSAPALSTNLARLLEKHRIDLGLEDFSVTSEATHWSGVVYGGNVEWIHGSPVPFIDVEIGSTRESYLNPIAAEVIAKALLELYEDVQDYPVVLYCGGMHFEETITRGILDPDHPVALTHILPSRWIENEQYAGEAGQLMLRRCIDSIQGGIRGFVVHEKLGRSQREMIGALAEEMGLPVVKRKALKSPEQTPFYGL
jgi:D-tyrosyl-tRNA(Tyr) deacylase